MALLGKLSKGCKVFCYHGPCLYEAKVLDVNTDGEPQVMLHYNGWKDRWDEWVDVNGERLVEYTDENIEKAKQLKEEQSTKKNKKKKSSVLGTSKGEGDSRASTPSLDSKQPKSSRASTASELEAPAPKSHKTDTKAGKGAAKNHKPVPSDVESPDEFASRPAVNLEIPDALKKMLVDDWDLVTRHFKLVKMPAEHTIESIVDAYTQSLKAQNLDEGRVHELTESGKGIISHFDKMLGTQMLYKFERPQYVDKVATSKLPPSQLYGMAHLLRLFVRIPTMLAFAHITNKSMQTVLNNCSHFLVFLTENSDKYMSLETDYETAPPEYQKRAWS